VQAPPPNRCRDGRAGASLGYESDDDLVALVARGDPAALGELYARLSHAAFGFALRVLHDRGLAEDAVQEAFLSVWRSAARFDPRRAPASTWVLTLVHRRAVDVVRRERARAAAPLDAVPAEDANGADEDAWLALERERVGAALRLLPDVQREALELAYYGGYTQTELAERLGQPLGTVKSRTFAGLARLRDLLAEEPAERKPEAAAAAL
jgi:RNA polymerase sigma-70 factor (ECF subfamily)